MIILLFIRSGLNTMCESVLCLICALYSTTIWSRHHSEELSRMRASKFLSRWKQYYLCLNSQSQLCLCLSHSSSCACRQAGFRAGRSAQVELHRDDGGPSEERDEEGGVVTLGAGAGRCPGPAAAEVANQDCSGRTALVKEPSACAMGSSSRTLLMAVCLRY